MKQVQNCFILLQSKLPWLQHSSYIFLKIAQDSH